MLDDRQRRRSAGAAARSSCGPHPESAPESAKDRVTATLSGTELATHLDLTGASDDLNVVAGCLDRLPDSWRTALVAHLSDPARRARPRSASHDPAPALLRLFWRLAGDEAHDTPLHRLGRPTGLLRDTLHLLDIAVEHTTDEKVLAETLRLLGLHVGWCTPQTIQAAARAQSPDVRRELAAIIGGNDSLYLGLGTSGPHSPQLHHAAHDSYLQHLTSGSSLHDQSRNAGSGSRTWHDALLRRPQGQLQRAWDPGSILNLAENLEMAATDSRRAEAWHALLAQATAGAPHTVETLTAVQEGSVASGATQGVVCADLETLLLHDRIDPDLASPVWAATAALRGTAQHVPLAQMSRRSRQAVWDAVWTGWLQRSAAGGRWPAWVPWPATPILLTAPATIIHADIPHPEPAAWLQDQIHGRLQDLGRAETATRSESDCSSRLVEEIYCQVLRLSVTWEGSIADLLDASVAAAG